MLWQLLLDAKYSGPVQHIAQYSRPQHGGLMDSQAAPSVVGLTMSSLFGIGL